MNEETPHSPPDPKIRKNQRIGSTRTPLGALRRPVTFTLLGYGFAATYKKGHKGIYQLVVVKEKWTRLKAELKHLTRKTIPMSFDERIQRLNWLIRGWTNYFKLASIQGKLKKLDEWIRNRLRYCIWSACGGEETRTQKEEPDALRC